MPLLATVSGIRGVFGDGLDPAVIVRYASAFAAWLREGADALADVPRVVVGRDGRVTGDVYRFRIARAVDLEFRSCWAGGRLPVGGGNECGEPFCGGAAHAWQQVLVGVHRERRVGVAQAFGHDLDRCPVGDEQRGVGVA